MFGKAKPLLLVTVLMVTISLLLPGCGCSQETGPASPVVSNLSFPHGAPPLNQTAELVYTVTADISLKNLSTEIILPDAFELVSGALSWSGDIAARIETEIIRTVVKSVETGNWIIRSNDYLNPDEHGGFGGNGGIAIYVSVAEDSAEWSHWAFWENSDPSALPLERMD